MKSILTQFGILLFSVVPCLAEPAGISIYQMNLKGGAPDLAGMVTAINKKAVPGLKVYTGGIKDGKFLIDLTDKSVPSPNPDDEEPRHLGTMISGTVGLNRVNAAGVRIMLRVRECQHVAYTYAKKDNRFFPSWSESKIEMLGTVDVTGWSVIDSDPGSSEARPVFFVQVTGNTA